MAAGHDNNSRIAKSFPVAHPNMKNRPAEPVASIRHSNNYEIPAAAVKQLKRCRVLAVVAFSAVVLESTRAPRELSRQKAS